MDPSDSALFESVLDAGFAYRLSFVFDVHIKTDSGTNFNYAVPGTLTKYPDYLRHDIVAIRIVQPEGRVWLEMFQDKLMDDGRLRDQVITRTDLGFISSGEDVGGNDSPMFSPSDSITKNAIKFVRDLDPFSIIMTTDLFHDDACYKIDKEHNPVYREP